MSNSSEQDRAKAASSGATEGEAGDAGEVRGRPAGPLEQDSVELSHPKVAHPKVAHPKVTVHEGECPNSGNPEVEVILETPRGCVSLILDAEGSMSVHLGPADLAAYEVLKGNVEDGKRAVYAIDYGDEQEHLILDDRLRWWRARKGGRNDA